MHCSAGGGALPLGKAVAMGGFTWSAAGSENIHMNTRTHSFLAEHYIVVSDIQVDDTQFTSQWF